ncbi:MAG: peptidyl-alpha-hydroxyglycine alpha-amidating lyase family protein [Bacteroidota bacterium]
MLKKIIYILFVVGGILLVAYFLQPLKKGSGLDATTRYEIVGDWLHLPAGLLLGNPTGIAIDTNQHIVVFHRADRRWPLVGSMPGTPIKHHTILVIHKETGELIKSWGENIFIMPHGLKVDKENNIWLTDVGLQQVFKFDPDGKLLMTVGEARIAGNDRTHFDMPTDIAIEADGSFYVSDGYGNSRIVKFSPAGKYLFEFGKKGTGTGEFEIPHSISLDSLGNLYVADRENERIQVFDSLGKFKTQYADESFGAICAVAFDKHQSKLFAVDEYNFLKLRHRGSDIFVFDKKGKVQTRFGRSGDYTGPVCWYHDLAIDEEENIFVGDILNNTIVKFKNQSSK